MRKLKPYFSKIALAAGVRRKFRYCAAPGFFRVSGFRHRIGDGRIGTVRKRADDFHLGFDLGISFVHDADRRLAARDEGKGRAHIFRLREFRLRGRPGSELFQSCLGVKAGRNGFHIGDGDTAVARKPGKVESLLDGHMAELGIRRRNQHQFVAKQVHACVRLDQLALGHVVHPAQIGGDEHVGGCALLDLPRQRGACLIARHHFDPGRLGKSRIGVVEGILQ